MANIAKLGVQWKVIYDLKPTDNMSASEDIDPHSLSIWLGELRGCCSITFPPGMVNLECGAVTAGKNYQLPKAGEWTRFELTQEFDEDVGRYFLSLSMGGKEVIKVDALEHEENSYIGIVNPDTSDVKPLDTGIRIGEDDIQIPGFIRRLVVLEKS